MNEERQGGDRDAASKPYVRSLIWAFLPFVVYTGWMAAYLRFASTPDDVNLAVALEAFLFVLVVSFTVLARRFFIGGWRLPKGASWIWVSIPLWLTIIGPLPLALPNIAEAPTKAVLWIGASFMVAVNEETLFRGFMLRGMLQSFRPMTTVLVTSLIFGLAHTINIFRGGDPALVGANAVGAAGIGAIYATMTLRSGSILPAMLLHFLTDSAGLSALGGFEQALRRSENPPAQIMTQVIAGLVFFAWGVFWSWRAVRAGKIAS